MALKTMDDMFKNELGDLYDAEHNFLEGMKKMLEQSTDLRLQDLLSLHITQTEGHIKNLEEVFGLLGEKAEREPCPGSRGLVTEASKIMRETASAPELRDYGIAGSASKAEHYEILSYEGLIAAATEMGNKKVVALLQRNLREEQEAAKAVEGLEPKLLKTALAASQDVAATR